MSRLNMVRKIKDWKKDPIKKQETAETKREKGWDDRFIYNKLEDNSSEKRQIQKKPDFTSNINFLQEQVSGNVINQKKSNKKRGKSGYKIYNDKNRNSKIKINSNNLYKYENSNNNMNTNNINLINNTGDAEINTISLLNEKKSRYFNNNIYKIINKNNNSADYNNNRNNNNCITSNLNDVSKNNSSTVLYSKTSNELEVYVRVLWNKLGIKESFQKTFNSLKEDMENEEAKREFMVMEIENLEKAEKFLKNISLDIEKREKSISKLKTFIEVIEKQFIELNLEITDNILKDFYQAIIECRINTIKVVENIALYNQYFSYSINKGKFCEDYLLKKYKLLIDNENDNNNNNDGMNYLLKIKNDLNFLGNSKINGYKQINLKFNSNSDPFLLSVAEQIPINIDYFRRVKQCQYIIMQEIIFNKINPEDKNNNNNNNNTSVINNDDKNKNKKSPINIRFSNKNTSIMTPSTYKILKKENISCIDKKDNLKNNNTDKRILEKTKNKRTEKIVIETQLIDKNNYDNFFGIKNLKEEQSEEHTLEDLKREFNIIEKIKHHKKEGIIIKENKDNKDNIDNKEEKENKDNIDNREEKENKDNKDNNEDLNIINNKELVKEKIDNNNDNIKNDINYNNKDIKENQEDNKNDKKKDENHINEDFNHNKEINNNMNNVGLTEDTLNQEKHKEEINKKENNNINEITKDKDNNEDFVNIEENLNIDDEQNKNIKIIDNTKKKDNNIEENILRNSLTSSKNSKASKEKSRSVTPQSQHNSKNISIKKTASKNKDNNIFNEKNEINVHQNKDNDYIYFYRDKISNFKTLYSSYYNTIPEEQKIIFNIKEDPLEYLYNNYYPKIIIYGDKKTKGIKGLIIISHIFTNDTKNNGLFIEHISSYNEDERENIFEKLLNFIKENSYNIFGFENNRIEKEIYIDLYYKNENGKFSINTSIRDFFKNQLKFKWVKLENISKFVRFQKMRHYFAIDHGNNIIDLLNNEYDDNNILNQSILGKKEFNNDDNKNESEGEEESEDDEINIDISRIFDIDNKNNESCNKDENENANDIHINKNINSLKNFSIKNKTVLKFNNKNSTNKNNINNITTFIKYSNSFNFIYLLNKINENENISYENISPNINNYFNQKDSVVINQIISNCFENDIKNNLTENHIYYSDVHELMKKNKNKFKINTNMNIYPIFDKCISFRFNNYYYNRIQQKKMETFMDRETQQIFYMINKSDNNILLISSSLNDNFKNKYINKENKDNLSIHFMNIYNNLIDLKKNNDNILYIPAFEIKCKLVNNCFCNINNNNNKSNLYCFEDYYNVKYLTEELMMIKNNKNFKKNKNINNDNICINFDYDLITENDTNKPNFIKDNFMLVVLNLNVVESLRALPLLTLYVTKDNFISNIE